MLIGNVCLNCVRWAITQCLGETSRGICRYLAVSFEYEWNASSPPPHVCHEVGRLVVRNQCFLCSVSPISLSAVGGEKRCISTYLSRACTFSVVLSCCCCHSSHRRLRGVCKDTHMKEVFQQNPSRRWNFATGCGVSAVFCFISPVRIAVCLCLTAWWGICSIFDRIPSCNVHRCFKSTGEPCRGHYNYSQDQYVWNLNLLGLCIFFRFFSLWFNDCTIKDLPSIKC